MPALSVVIIAQNEARRLPATLAAAGFAEEILVIDGGSTDDTLGVCRAAGVRVLSRPFDHFKAQKQFGLEQARHPWVLCLDADEVVSPELRQEICQLLRAEPPCAGYILSLQNIFLSTLIRHGGWYPCPKLRLARRADARWVGGPVHETLQVSGPLGNLPGSLWHEPYRNLSEHLRKIMLYARLWADHRAGQGQQVAGLELIFRPGWHFFRRYLLNGGWLDGLPGLLLALLGAFSVLLKYALLLERNLGFLPDLPARVPARASEAPTASPPARPVQLEPPPSAAPAPSVPAPARSRAPAAQATPSPAGEPPPALTSLAPPFASGEHE